MAEHISKSGLVLTCERIVRQDDGWYHHYSLMGEEIAITSSSNCYREKLELLGEISDINDGPDDGTDDYSRDHGGRYCRHGVYIGTPGGADILCGRCESGD